MPLPLVIHLAPGPQGEGSQGSGFSIHLWFSQTYPDEQSGSLTHSGLQPVMVSGLGIKPGSHLQIGLAYLLPCLGAEHLAPGPQGEGLQGSGSSTHLWFKQTCPDLHSLSVVHSGPHPVMVSGLGMRPGSQLQMALPTLLTVQMAPGPQGEGTQGLVGLRVERGTRT